MTKVKALICPYCGETQPNGQRCRSCGGLFEPLSRQATQNQMGPWFIRVHNRPFQPGCSYETLVALVERGQVDRHTVMRGPTTRQFWTIAKRVPGVAHLLGSCHQCDTDVRSEQHGCPSCGEVFGAYLDRNHMGLGDIRPLPWEPGHGETRTNGDAGAHGRLSSFASDAELFGGAVTAAMHTESERAVPAPAAPAESSERQDQPAMDEDALGAAAWAARRQITSLQRTTRLLMVLIVAQAVVLVVVFAMLWRGREVAVPVDPLATPATEWFAPDEEVAPPVVTETDPVVETEAVEVEEPAPAESFELPAVEPPAPVPGPYDDELRQAQTLIDAAAQSDRPVPDRIADYEKAVGILETIIGASPDDDLTALVESARREIEALRLKEFFP